MLYTTRNIFFIKGRNIYTPAIDLGILNAITRKKIIQLSLAEGYSIKESRINYDDINDMDEAFITSTGVDILPCYWEGWSSDYIITNKLKNLYTESIKIK